jgi:AcrR family transcriptional regulator
MDEPSTARPNQREHILDVALELMSANGFAGTSMRQLAQACGVQVAAIYHYFPSKDALLASVFDERRYSSRLADPVEVRLDAPLAERLRAVFDLFWNGALEEEPVLRLLLGEAIRNEPVAAETGSALLGVFRSGVVAALEEFAPELDDTKGAADVLVAQIFAGFIRHLFEPDIAPPVIGDQVADVLVSAVLGPPRAD